MPENETRYDAWHPGEHANAELGVLKLSRGQFVEALDTLYRNHFWQDAAQIAE